jgi:hypothetical protein
MRWRLYTEEENSVISENFEKRGETKIKNLHTSGRPPNQVTKSNTIRRVAKRCPSWTGPDK